MLACRYPTVPLALAIRAAYQFLDRLRKASKWLDSWTLVAWAAYTLGMSRTIPAIFDAGVFRPLEPVELAEGTKVEVQVPRPAIAPSDERSAEEFARQAAAMAWPDFVKQTYGSCAGLGLQRHEQGDFEAREPIA